jgi:hypothetical protein
MGHPRLSAGFRRFGGECARRRHSRHGVRLRGERGLPSKSAGLPCRGRAPTGRGRGRRDPVPIRRDAPLISTGPRRNQDRCWQSATREDAAIRAAAHSRGHSRGDCESRNRCRPPGPARGRTVAFRQTTSQRGPRGKGAKKLLTAKCAKWAQRSRRRHRTVARGSNSRFLLACSDLKIPTLTSHRTRR